MNDVVKKDMKSNKENVVDPVLNVELMSKASIYKFQGNVLSPFIKITLAIPRLIAAVKRLVSGGDVPGVPSTTRVRRSTRLLIQRVSIVQCRKKSFLK